MAIKRKYNQISLGTKQYLTLNVASCYGAIIGILWIIGLSLQGTVLNMIYSVFNVVKYNSNDVL